MKISICLLNFLFIQVASECYSCVSKQDWEFYRQRINGLLPYNASSALPVAPFACTFDPLRVYADRNAVFCKGFCMKWSSVTIMDDGSLKVSYLRGCVDSLVDSTVHTPPTDNKCYQNPHDTSHQPGVEYTTTCYCKGFMCNNSIKSYLNMLKVVLITLIGGSLACFPAGTGPLYTSATFEYSISPPATWTWNAAPLMGQKTSAEQAKSQAESDFKSALTTVLKDNDLSISNVQYTIDYTPQEIVIEEEGANTGLPATACISGSTGYIYYGGTIIYSCDATGKATQYSPKASVTVKSPSPIYKSVWDNLNYQVQYELMVNKAQFNDAGTTTYKS
ncbi:hypothetical protein WR25_14843 [Diploscapter pachys]|uniref:Uncharacterized protein n=1 Tax=Diploscapter pachys TaxID=2018661 RepID=A0A2A2KN71_9BILA|nr:hypothetical protein WR25_14843 [Diploscapter pachys]